MKTSIYANDRIPSSERKSLYSVQDDDFSYETKDWFSTTSSSRNPRSEADMSYETESTSMTTRYSGSEYSSFFTETTFTNQGGCGAGPMLDDVHSLLSNIVGYVAGIKRRCAYCQQPVASNKAGLMRNISTGELVFIHYECYEFIPSLATTNKPTTARGMLLNEGDNSSITATVDNETLNTIPIERHEVNVEPTREQQGENEASCISPNWDTWYEVIRDWTTTHGPSVPEENNIIKEENYPLATTTLNKNNIPIEQQEEQYQNEESYISPRRVTGMQKRKTVVLRTKSSPQTSLKSKRLYGNRMERGLWNKNESRANKSKVNKPSKKKKKGIDSEEAMERTRSLTSLQQKRKIYLQNKKKKKNLEWRLPTTKSKSKVQCTPQDARRTNSRLTLDAAPKSPRRKWK